MPKYGNNIFIYEVCKMKILEKIESIVDPRMEGKVRHKLSTIIFASLCGVLSGCEDWPDIRDYCEAKQDWLSRYVSLENGIPSSDTFRRVFTMLNPDHIEYLLRTHAKEIIASTKEEKATDQVSLDGKALRGSKRHNTKNLHSVSAWCHENGLILGERHTDTKSNEITAIPVLLNSLDLKGNTVTVDAAGCQKSIVELIANKDGDYVLGLKRNHPKLYEAVEKYVAEQEEKDENCLADYIDKSHGRCVWRQFFSYDVKELPEITDWTKAKTVVVVETVSSKDNDPDCKISGERRYYLSSHDHTNKRLPNYIRNHWGIENKVHWILDVHLKEDDDKKAERNSARSFGLLKRIALNIVRTKDLTPKRSLRRKLKRSAWDNAHLLFLLEE